MTKATMCDVLMRGRGSYWFESGMKATIFVFSRIDHSRLSRWRIVKRHAVCVKILSSIAVIPEQSFISEKPYSAQINHTDRASDLPLYICVGRC